MATRHGFSKIRDRAGLGVRLARGVGLVALCSALMLHGAFNHSACAQGSDDDLSLDFVKKQLARVRSGTPAAQNENNPQAMQEESERLLAEESALLNKMSGHEAEALPAKSNAADAPRASADLDRALDALTSPKGKEASADANLSPESAPELIHASIPVVKEAPKTKSAAEVKAAKITESPSAESEVAKSADSSVSVILKPVEPSEDAVDSMLRSAKQESQPAAALSIPVAAEKVEARAADSEKKSSAQEQSILNAQRANMDLKRQLDATQRRLRDSTKELEEVRSRLMIAETEVERLSSMLETRNRTNLARVAPGVPVLQAQREYPAPAPRQNVTAPTTPMTQTSATPKIKSDMMIATVTAEKANLRSGPGKNNSPMMSVSRGTRLAIETRNGEWYRVITPTGTRAWVSADVLAFGSDIQSAPTRTVHIGGIAERDDHAAISFANR